MSRLSAVIGAQAPSAVSERRSTDGSHARLLATRYDSDDDDDNDIELGGSPKVCEVKENT